MYFYQYTTPNNLQKLKICFEFEILTPRAISNEFIDRADKPLVEISFLLSKILFDYCRLSSQLTSVNAGFDF